MSAKRKYYVLRGKRGMGGLTSIKPVARKQDRRFETGEFYAVVFFPKVRGIGKAHVGIYNLNETLSQSKKAAIAKFMDRIVQTEKWKTYHDAGHRVRRVRVIDLGDA